MMNESNSKDSNSDKDQEEKNTDFGCLLAEVRKTRNYTVEEVSGHLKIPVHMIKALEASDKEALPAPTFTRGYIRAYAKFLEMPEDEVITVYGHAVPQDDSSDLKPRSNLPDEANSQSPLIKAITWLLMVGVFAAIVIGGFQYYQKKAGALESQLDTKQESFTGNSLNSPGSYPLTIKQNARLVDGERVAGTAEPVVKEITTADAADSSDKNTEAVSISEEKTVAAPGETVAEAADRDDSIEIIAEKGSWVEVRDANKSRLLYNMLPAGASRMLTGRAPFSVTMGNAKTTRVVVNDIEIDVSDYIRLNNTASFKVSTQDQDIIFH